jgi:hypothetical protein
MKVELQVFIFHLKSSLPLREAHTSTFHPPLGFAALLAKNLPP